MIAEKIIWKIVSKSCMTKIVHWNDFILRKLYENEDTRKTLCIGWVLCLKSLY